MDVRVGMTIHSNVSSIACSGVSDDLDMTCVMCRWLRLGLTVAQERRDDITCCMCVWYIVRCIMSGGEGPTFRAEDVVPLMAVAKACKRCLKEEGMWEFCQVRGPPHLFLPFYGVPDFLRVIALAFIQRLDKASVLRTDYRWAISVMP